LSRAQFPHISGRSRSHLYGLQYGLFPFVCIGQSLFSPLYLRTYIFEELRRQLFFSPPPCTGAPFLLRESCCCPPLLSSNSAQARPLSPFSFASSSGNSLDRNTPKPFLYSSFYMSPPFPSTLLLLSLFFFYNRLELPLLFGSEVRNGTLFPIKPMFCGLFSPTVRFPHLSRPGTVGFALSSKKSPESVRPFLPMEYEPCYAGVAPAQIEDPPPSAVSVCRKLGP